MPNHLPDELTGAERPATLAEGTDQGSHLETVLQRHDWCIESAAKELGIARSTLYRQMDRLRIVAPWRKTPER